MPPGLAQALGPVLQQIAEMTLKIKQYDRQIQQLGRMDETLRCDSGVCTWPHEVASRPRARRSLQ
jgi:hypothetical protein